MQGARTAGITPPTSWRTQSAQAATGAHAVEVEKTVDPVKNAAERLRGWESPTSMLPVADSGRYSARTQGAALAPAWLLQARAAVPCAHV
jgi:hypothetical protein